MQQGDQPGELDQTPGERNLTLDARYREDGWGLITDQVWDEKVAPTDVESAARDVARWAYEAIKGHVDAFNRQGNQLVEQDQQITDLQRIAGAHARQLTVVAGLKSALLQKEVELKRMAVEAARERAAHADVAGNLAACELALAELKLEGHISADAPTRINPRSLRNWLNPPEMGESNGCSHD